MNPSDLYTFIAAHPYAVISTLAADGMPQSALIGIAVTPNLEIIFDTLSTTRKYANLLASPSCSLVIGWDDEQTLQYEGTAFLPPGPDLARYQAAYFARWPDGPTRLTWPDIAYIVVRPTWIRYSDFNQQPPTIEEFHLPASFPAAMR
jgi:Pyridoxamine 5'-phosphate oxidase